jgi:hypothetical protein
MTRRNEATLQIGNLIELPRTGNVSKAGQHFAARLCSARPEVRGSLPLDRTITM